MDNLKVYCSSSHARKQRDPTFDSATVYSHCDRSKVIYAYIRKWSYVSLKSGRWQRCHSGYNWNRLLYLAHCTIFSYLAYKRPELSDVKALSYLINDGLTICVKVPPVIPIDKQPRPWMLLWQNGRKFGIVCYKCCSSDPTV